MPPKDKKAKAKPKKGTPTAGADALTKVDREFFELTITDLNKRLSRLKSELATYENKNAELTIKLQANEEDRDDTAAHLQKILNNRDGLITEQAEIIQVLKRLYKREAAESGSMKQDFEQQYKDMKSQLMSEIKLIKGQLNSLSEFRRLRDSLYVKYDDLREEEIQRTKEHEEQLFKMQQTTVVEKEDLKKDIENNLIQVARDFTLSNEIRNAGFTRRLIRENVALQKENEKLIETQLQMKKHAEERREKNNKIREENCMLKDLQPRILKSNNNKISIIEKLTNNYERLKTKYIELLRIHKHNVHVAKEQNVAYEVMDMVMEFKKFHQTIEGLKLENSYLQAALEQSTCEKEKLEKIIQKMKEDIEEAIGATTRPDASASIIEIAERKTTRVNLLCHLMNILTRGSDVVQRTPSVMTVYSNISLYNRGNMGLVPRQNVCVKELFKRDTDFKSSTQASENAVLTRSDSKIIPKERILDAGSIIDVEWGTPLCISSSHEDLLVEVQDDDGEGEGDSSSYMSAPPGDKSEQKSTVDIQQEESNADEALKKGSSSIQPKTSTAHNSWMTLGEEEDFYDELFY